MKKFTVLVLCLIAAGCASTVKINQQYVEIGGKGYHYIFAESQNEVGINHIVIDRFDNNGNLIARDSASNSGIMQAVIPAVITGASTAGGLIGAASVLRPDQTNITTTGTDTSGSVINSSVNSPNSGSTSTTPTVSVNNTNLSGSTSTSTATSKNVNTNANSNTNSNINRNKNTNSNSNTNTNSNKSKTKSNNGNHGDNNKNK